MFRITRQADYAIVLLCQLALHPGQSLSAADLARRTGLPQPMSAKVLKHLARGGVLESHRGAQGGFRLRRSPESLTVAEIVEILDGTVGLTTCTDEDAAPCALVGTCSLSGHWQVINDAIVAVLERVTLAHMIRPVPAAGLLACHCSQASPGPAPCRDGLASTHRRVET